MAARAEDKSYIDAIDERASEALELATENAKAIAGLVVTATTLTGNVDRMIEAAEANTERGITCRREVDNEVTSLATVLRKEMKEAVDALNDRITSLVNRTYWVAGFSAAAGVVVGVFIAR